MDEPFSEPARFDALLAGIAAEAAAADDAADDAQIEELERAARAQRRLLDRLRGAGTARVEVAGGPLVSGVVAAVGRDVVVLADTDSDWLIPPWGIAAVVGLAATPRPATTLVEQLGITAVLRAWARERSVVRVHRLGVSALDGTIDEVGADYIDLAEHDPGEPRRASAVRRIATVPLGSIAAVRRR